MGIFAANKTFAEVTIPIVEDLNSNEGTEYFIMHLSAYSNITDDVEISLGNIQEATVFIQDEIFLSFLEENILAKEGGNLTLTVTANTASDQEFNISTNITSISAQCKPMLNAINSSKHGIFK